MFSLATLRHYDSTTLPFTIYSKSIFPSRHCDTTTVRHHTLIYIVILYFLQRHCDSTTPPLTIYIYGKSIFSPVTLGHYDSTTPPLTIYGKSIFLQRHYDSTTPPLTIYSKSIFPSATLRHYDSTIPPFTIYSKSIFPSATLRQYDTTP